MRISTFWYCFKQGIINICRNIWFSLASTAIITACIFLFCVFFSIITNVQHMVVTAESNMGITIFFEETLSGDEIQEIGKQIAKEKSSIIKEMEYISAEAAWEEFKNEYFGDNLLLADGFAEDNPLAGSSSYEIRLYDISKQEQMVKYLHGH